MRYTVCFATLTLFSLFGADFSNVQMSLPISGTPQGGQVSLGSRTNAYPVITVNTNTGDSEDIVASRLALELQARRPATFGASRPMWYSFQSLKGNSIIFENAVAGDYYLTSTDLGIVTVGIPTGLRVSAQGLDIQVSWNQVPNADAYIVYRNGRTAGKFRQTQGLDAISSPNVRVTNIGIEDEVKFDYTIISTKGNISSPPSAKVSIPNPLATPSAINVRIITTERSFVGQVGNQFSQPLAAQGGTSPYTWSIQSGQLPQGITLSADGLLSGSPAQQEKRGLVIRVLDSAGHSDSRVFAVKVNP